MDPPPEATWTGARPRCLPNHLGAVAAIVRKASPKGGDPLSERPKIRSVEYLPQGEVALPAELDLRTLRRRALQVTAVLAVVVLVALLAPGLGDVRDELARMSPGWLAAGIAFEVLSCLSYVVMFGPIFCERMSRRTGSELALSELAVGSIVPAAGPAASRSASGRSTAPACRARPSPAGPSPSS